MVAAGGPFGLGPLELGLIIVVLVMLFGATRLADVGGSLGKGIKEFRKNIKDEDEAPAPPPAAPVATAAPPTQAPATNGASDANVVTAVKCPNCGNLNPMGARHCNQCGTSLATPVS
jgi:sec-independent protein translocase protein TatA